MESGRHMRKLLRLPQIRNPRSAIQNRVSCACPTPCWDMESADNKRFKQFCPTIVAEFRKKLFQPVKNAKLLHTLPLANLSHPAAWNSRLRISGCGMRISRFSTTKVFKKHDSRLLIMSEPNKVHAHFLDEHRFHADQLLGHRRSRDTQLKNRSAKRSNRSHPT